MYLKTTFRNLWKNKGYSFLNIAGLAIGITFAALVFLWVEDEFNYDRTQEKKEQLYLTYVHQEYEGGKRTHTSSPGQLGPAIKSDVPGITNTCRMTEDADNYLFSYGEQAVYLGSKYAEPSLFSMFILPFAQGGAATQPGTVVLTEQAAKRLLGNDYANAVGKTVQIGHKKDYLVSGVLKDLPDNSSIRFDCLLPFEEAWKEREYLHEWGNLSLLTYVELAKGADLAAVNKQLDNYLQKHVEKTNVHLSLYGMPNWRLYGQFANGQPSGGGRITYVRLFLIIAFIILFIACINFMNLATARSSRKAKEVSVRKVLGAGKGSLVLRFIGESIIVAMLAAVLAVGLTALCLPAFNALVQKDLSLGLENPLHISMLLGITLLCGVVAGSYPSFYLSSFNPISVMKGLKGKGGNVAIVRKGLVVGQFAISIVLIICTVIVYQQIEYVKKRDLGYEKNNLLALDMQGQMGEHYASIRESLLATGQIENVASTDHAVVYGGNNTGGFRWDGKDPEKNIVISFRIANPEYFPTLGMQIIDGHNFQATDTVSAIITESMAKLMGKGSPIGKKLYTGGFGYPDLQVVGVVKDYVYGNVYDAKADPVVFFNNPRYANSVMYVRPKANADIQQVLAATEGVLKQANPGYPFSYRFVDDQFNGFFFNEQLISKLARIFASLAIFISCLGLFGLAAYTAEQRTKEIGIRKVLGASAAGIAALLSKDFMKLVGIAALVAFPLAWYGMHQWLQGYAYRIGISVWVFVLAGGMALLIALLTISVQSVKAALINPVKSLKTE